MQGDITNALYKSYKSGRDNILLPMEEFIYRGMPEVIRKVYSFFQTDEKSKFVDSSL